MILLDNRSLINDQFNEKLIKEGKSSTSDGSKWQKLKFLSELLPQNGEHLNAVLLYV